MLSEQEKQEMLKDARCGKRRESFRKAQIRQPVLTYGAYLKFLSRIQKMFSHAEESITKSSEARFKL